MKITNKINLPLPLVEAVKAHKYDKGDADFSVTGLIKPSRIVALERKHEDNLEEDASDRLWALIGSIGHSILAAAAENPEGSRIVEKKLFAEFDGVKIKGQCDLAEDGIIHDFKFTSIWAVKDGVKPEWEQQMNMYDCLARMNGMEVSGMQIIAILRDWNVSASKRESNYPPSQVVPMWVRRWLPKEQEWFIIERIRSHQRALNGDLPECTPAETWERPSTWAVKKRGNKRAVKVYDNDVDAVAHAHMDSALSVEFRPGARPRCESYCAVSKWCQQYQNFLKLNEGETPTEPAQGELI